MSFSTVLFVSSTAPIAVLRSRHGRNEGARTKPISPTTISFHRSSQTRRLQLIIPYRQVLFGFNTVILEHSGIFPHILALDFQPCLGLLGFQNVVIVAVRAVLVAILVLTHVFAEHLFALFAREHHFHCLLKAVCLLLGVAFGTVEPLFAAWGANGDLRVEDVFAVKVLAYSERNFDVYDTHTT